MYICIFVCCCVKGDTKLVVSQLVNTCTHVKSSLTGINMRVTLPGVVNRALRYGDMVVIQYLSLKNKLLP